MKHTTLLTFTFAFSAHAEKLPEKCRFKSSTRKINYGELSKTSSQWLCHENGLWHSVTNYKNGKKHGKETWWHDNGQKSTEGNHKNDNAHGKWTYWNEDGMEVK